MYEGMYHSFFNMRGIDSFFNMRGIDQFSNC